jgi:TRAP-type C4-dicarboxylate transport system permease large subunit
MYTGVKYKILRTTPSVKEMSSAFWAIKWELLLPVLILGSLSTGLADIDESAAIAALYVILVEMLVHKDLQWKDLPRLAASSMALAGALILIMTMAMALTNFLISEQVPSKLFDWVTSIGITERWHFLVALNFFMFIQGALMEGFSSIFVAVPLLIPFGAEFHLSPFHLCMMFLLNLEIAFLAPPFGQNLFVTSFRFQKPMASLYRIAVPFLGILIIGLMMIMYIPKLSTIAVERDIAQAKAKSALFNEAPREAWLMECVQEDRNNPLPCTPEDRARWAHGKDVETAPLPDTAAPQANAAPPDDEKLDQSEDELLKEMLDGEKGHENPVTSPRR